MEAAVSQEKQPCPSCTSPSVFLNFGSASGRRHFRCARCGPWVEKNLAAVALGARGGEKSASLLTSAQHRERMTRLAKRRWRKKKAKKIKTVAT